MYERVTANFILSCRKKTETFLSIKYKAKIGALPISIQHNTKDTARELK